MMGLFSRKKIETITDSPRYVFIGGLHRSGTSLLHRMLSELPEVTGFDDTGVPEDEGQHLQSVYPAAKRFGGPGKFCFDSRSYMDEQHALVNDTNREQLIKDWERHWDDASVRIEKSPPNLIRSRFLQAMFPDSQFIFIVRHPIAVSMATQKWSHTSERELMLHWQLAHKRMMQDVKQLKKAIVIRYEDMVAKPERVMRQLAAFVDLPYQSSGLEVKQEINERYYVMWEEKAAEQPDFAKKIRHTKLHKQFGYELRAPYVLPIKSIDF